MLGGLSGRRKPFQHEKSRLLDCDVIEIGDGRRQLLSPRTHAERIEYYDIRKAKHCLYGLTSKIIAGKRKEKTYGIAEFFFRREGGINYRR